jgi:hypothetical protein
MFALQQRGKRIAPDPDPDGADGKNKDDRRDDDLNRHPKDE